MPEREPSFEPDIQAQEPTQEQVVPKEKQWAEFTERFDKETDALGMKIEKGIKDTVVGLNALGFNT